jgi:hypothetical protein
VEALLAQVLPLAVGAAVSPAMLGLQVLNLSRPRSPMAWAWSMAAGAAALLAAATLAAFLLHVSTSGSRASPESRGVVKLIAGVILLAVAVRLLTGSHDRPPPRLLEEADDARGWVRWPAVVVGAGLVAPNLAVYFPAVHELAASREPAGARGALMVFTFAMAMLPAAGPPLAVLALGDRARPPLDAVNRWVTEHRRRFTAALCLIFGLALVGLGLTQVL